jgi:hypothetical protein
MDRRTYLAACAPAVGGLAGCGGDDSGAPPRDPATFGLLGLHVPASIPVGGRFRVAAVVQNTGDEEGTVTSALSVRSGGAWERRDALELAVEPGVARAWRSGPIPAGSGSELTVRLDRFDATATVSVGPGTYEFGQYYRSPTGLLLTAYDASISRTYEYGAEGETETHRAPDGERWAFVRVNAENTGDAEAEVPEASAFSLLVDGSVYSPADVRRERGRWRGGTLAPGGSRDGWIAYAVPAATEVGDLLLRWRPADAPAPVRYRPER